MLFTDVRLLINPFNFMQKTTPKPEHPTIVVKPEYPSYHYRPHHHYDDDDDYYYRPRPRPRPRPHPPVYSLYPEHPPLYPAHPPLYPQHPPLYPYYPQSSYGYGYGPYYSRPRPPVIVVVRPSNDDKNGNNDLMEVPTDKSRYFYRSPMYEYADEEVMPEVVNAEERPQYEYEGRNIKVDGVAINADSEEDNDTITVDTKDVKLPFGLHLTSLPRDAKKVRDQEALIYLRNYKNGRKLRNLESA